MKPLKKRPTIGLLVSGLTEYFTASLCRGVMQAAEAADVNNLTTVLEDLCLYLSRSADTEQQKYEIKELFSLMYRKIIHAMNSLFGTIQAEKEDENYMFKLFVTDLTQFEKGNDQSYANILSGLDFAGIRNAALYLFREPILHLSGEPFFCPEKVYLKTVLVNGSVHSISLPHQKMRVKDIFRYPGIPHDQFSMVLLPLFSNEFLYGLVLCDLTENLFSNGEFLLNQMSSAAKFLQDSFGKRGVCGRIGGDEFVCLVPCSGAAMSVDLYRTLHSAFDLFNRTSEKAYNITVSTGFYLLPKDMDSTLPEMLAHADAMLYEEKQKRDKNVAKILPK